MEREIPQETLETRARLSSRFVIGIMAARGDSVATAEPAALQTGQSWEDTGPAVKSAQKWNCAPRNIIARSRARVRICRVSRCT